MKIQKKYVFNIFASFLAFSTSSKKEFKFSKVFGTRLTFHASFLKSLIFLIESTLILLVFKKYKKIKKNQIYKKEKKLRDQFWGSSNIFAYK
jgi:predicted membrane protein